MPPRPLFILCLTALLASLLGSAAVVHQRRTQTFGAVSGLPDPALAPRPPLLAVNVELTQYSTAELQRALDQLTPFYWLRQKFDVSATDEHWGSMVEATTARHQHLIAVLVSPQLSSPTDFAANAGAFAARYQNQIDVYQIWDEPNLWHGWGGQAPSAAGYAALLQAAYTAIHANDPTATVLAAALAPTVETGPDNLSDLIYLQQLYDLGAGAYFDAAAGKPYGFYTGPDDRQTDPMLLNFSRFTLLRQVMERNGDGHKLLWGGNFGWNTHADSPWGHATVEQQIEYTLAAYTRAAHEWPWAGPLALENYQPPAPADNPVWGFALADPAHQLTALGQSLSTFHLPPSTALPGNYTAHSPVAYYTGAWEFSELGADIPEDYANAQLTFAFQGTDLALTVRRGDYRAHLYVEVDGHPANLLPRDGPGAYLILTSPDLNPQVNTVPVASGLNPAETHIAIIRPERGWDQWALVGFSVGRRFPDEGYSLALGALLGVMVVGALGTIYLGRQLKWGQVGEWGYQFWQRLGATGQMALTALVSGVLYLTAWLTFGDDMVVITRRFGDATPIALTALTAGLLYFSPSLLIGLIALLILFLLIYLRPDLGLALIALALPFYLSPVTLWQRGLSPVELATLFTFAAWLLRHLRPGLHWVGRYIGRPLPPPHRALPIGRAGVGSTGAATAPLPLGPTGRHTGRPLPSPLDLAFLALLLTATLSLFTTELKIVALREYRVVIVEPLLFYFLLRVTLLDSKALWRIVDCFLLGATLMAGIGLYQYFTGTNLIQAEGGLMRLRSVYGSPNNVALYLGRALPIALAVLLMGRHQLRRIGYGVMAGLMALTIILTFSKGAWLLGVPASIVVLLIGWQGKRGWVLVGATAALGLTALPILSRLPRFANLLDFTRGTGFFRLKLWTAAWQMALDHPLLGVGLDNFLYQYRGHYILPEAWQEPNLSHPHNLVLDFATRLGLFGLACGVWLQVAFWRTAVDTYHRLSSHPESRALCLGLMAAMANVLAHGLVDHSFFLVDLAFVFCLLAALLQHLRQSAAEQSDTPPA